MLSCRPLGRREVVARFDGGEFTSDGRAILLRELEARTGTGTPQRGVISPLLASIYLHEVMDRWFEHVVEPYLQGPAFMIRCADVLVVCRLEVDARKVLDVLPR
jgi:hypothetical protein